MNPQDILFLIYLGGFLLSFSFLCIKGKFMGEGDVFFFSAIWFVVFPIGFIWKYFYERKEKRKAIKILGGRKNETKR